MGAAHASPEGLFHAGASVVHRLPAHVKIVATVVSGFLVVAVPREAVLAFPVAAALMVGVAALARLPMGLVVRRLRIEVPFLAFAVFMPVVGGAPRVDVLGVSLSEPGLWGAWNIVAKGTIGVLAGIVLAATTPIADLLRGLERLHVPRVLTGIGGFMVRYLDVIAGEATRMRIARLSRGYDPRWLWQARAIAASAGTLFVRSYERGERVYLAMRARGYDGTMPDLDHHDDGRHAWTTAALLPIAMAIVLGFAHAGTS